jgi:hypothetical protein
LEHTLVATSFEISVVCSVSLFVSDALLLLDL